LIFKKTSLTPGYSLLVPSPCLLRRMFYTTLEKYLSTKGLK
jgi:hypothetical protein